MRARRVLFVTGDRNWEDPEPIARAFDATRPDLVIEGEARGADRLAREEANRREIEVEGYPADWPRYQGGAGPIRNREMLDRLVQLRSEGHYVYCFAFHEDLSRSKGTKHMVELLKGASFGCALVRR